MSALSNFVSLHPYFKVHHGKLETVKAALQRFIEKTATERENLFYGFSIIFSWEKIIHDLASKVHEIMDTLHGPKPMGTAATSTASAASASPRSRTQERL